MAFSYLLILLSNQCPQKSIVKFFCCSIKKGTFGLPKTADVNIWILFVRIDGISD
jgi:hypothetical protein